MTSHVQLNLNCSAPESTHHLNNMKATCSSDNYYYRPHQSATTMKPLTLLMATDRCSSGESCMLVFNLFHKHLLLMPSADHNVSCTSHLTHLDLDLRHERTSVCVCAKLFASYLWLFVSIFGDVRGNPRQQGVPVP